MFALSQAAVASVVAFVLLAIAYLIAIGTGGFVNAYMNLFIGDRLAIEEGYGSLNPFVHVDLLGMVLFLFFKILWRSSQPFGWDWAPGMRGFFERIVYFCGTATFHLFGSFLCLLTGLFIWHGNFFSIAMGSFCVPSQNMLMFIHNVFPHISSFSAVSMMLMCFLILAHITLFLFELLVKTVDYVFMTYIFPYNQEAWVHLLSVISIYLIFYIFGDTLWALGWWAISRPAFLIAQACNVL